MARLLRALVVVGFLLTLATCRDGMEPQVQFAPLAVAPVLPSKAAMADFGLTIDGVRFVVVRLPTDTVADTTVAILPDVHEVTVDIRVPVFSRHDSVSVSVIALSDTLPLFAGTRVVPIPTPLPPPEILVDQYVGPAVDSIVIQPRNPFIRLSDSLRFQVQAFNGGVPASLFYVSWTTSDTTLAPISPLGMLHAPGARSSVRVRARTPTGQVDSVVARFTPPAIQLVSITGTGQIDTVGQQLSLPLEVEARGADGLGVGGVTVRFRSLVGSGSVTDTVVVTDTAGRARTTATLGSVLGVQTFDATVAGLTGSPVTFSATALPGPPAQLIALLGDAQLAVVGSPVAVSPAVVVRDAGGNPVQGVAVSFSVTGGGGSITGANQTTDVNGLATVGSWTVGTAVGPNTLRADAGALSRSFTATGIAGAASQLVTVAGDLQSAVVGNVLAIDPAVRVQDQFGNPVAGAAVTFAVSGGGGSVTGASQLSNAAGVATLGSWTLGTVTGANTLSATVSGLTALTFSATATPGAATAILKLAGDLQSGVVNTALGAAPRVRLTDQFGNPVAGATVTFAVSGGGGGVTGGTQATDATGAASVGSWSLGTATGVNELTASFGGLAAVFSANALPDAPAQIARLAGNAQSAVVNAVLPINPAVIVRDQYNNPVPGVAVVFTPSGNGSVTGGNTTTDASGVATVGSWRLDTLATTNNLVATHAALSTTFSATGLPGPLTQLTKTAGDGLSAVVGSTLATDPTVRARDQYNNAIGGLTVTFSVTGGNGSITGATPTTNASGFASLGSWTLDTLVGANAVTAMAGALSAVFSANGTADVPNKLTKLQGDLQTAVVNTPLPTNPAVQLTDRYGNTIAGDTIDFVLLNGGSIASLFAVTNAAGQASPGTWTIASLAGPTGLRATVRNAAVPAAQFAATGTHDVAFQLVRVSIDPQTAIAGQAVSVPPAVRVRDQYTNSVPGVSVTFALTGVLQGFIAPSVVTTDANGLAQVGSWTLAAVAGLNTLDASVAGLAGSPVSFSANGVTTTATSIAFGPSGGGNGQTATVGSVLAPYSVFVADLAGLGVQNVQVHWAVATGGGSVNVATSTTDVNGIASATLTLGLTAGTQSVTASVSGLSGSPVTFASTALPDVPAQIVKLAGDSQSVAVDATVPVAPSVRVTDAHGNPIAAVTVSFAPGSGGSVVGGTPVTDAAGVATVGSWRVGTTVGGHALTVSTSGVTPVTFDAFAAAGAASSVTLLDGNGQSGPVAQPLPAPYRVTVRDAFGNPKSGVTVQWEQGARAGGGIAPPSVVTDGNGIAAAVHTLGSSTGAYSAFAFVVGLADTVVFTSTAVGGAAAIIEKDAGDVQSAIVNTAVAIAPSVKVTDQFGAPVAGHSVDWTITAGGGTLGAPTTTTTDAAGIATAPTWTLGTAAGTNGLNAASAGLTGSPVPFTATGQASSATQMAVNAGNGQSALVGTAVAIKPAVILKDQFNNPVPNAQVVFTVVSGGGDTTGGTATTNAQGIATLSAWTLGTTAGLNTLRATSTGVQPVTFIATGLAGAPAQLAFVTPPSRAIAGDTIDPAVQVAIQDQFGNTVLGVSDVVSLVLGATPDPAAKLVGTTDVPAVNGVATFAELAIDSAGAGYTLRAGTVKLPGFKESQPFDVGGVIAALTFDRWQPVAAAVNSATSLVYVPGLNNNLGVLDPGKSLTMVPGFQTPFGVAVNSLTNMIYVTTVEGLVEVDGRDNSKGQVVNVGLDPKGVAVDEESGLVFVAVAGDPQKGEPPSLAIVDPKDTRTVPHIPFPEGALAGIGVAFNPNDRLVYVAVPNLGVAVFDPGGLRFVTMISIIGEKGAAGTYGVAVDTRTNLVYATNRAEHTVSVIDLAGFKEFRRLPVGLLPEGVGVDGDRGAVYVGNSGENTVSFIDAGTLTVIATLLVGPQPKAAAVHPASGRFFVPTLADDRVRMVEP